MVFISSLNFILDFRIYRESHLRDIFEKRALSNCEACFHSQRPSTGQIIAMNRIDHVFEPGFEQSPAGRILLK